MDEAVIYIMMEHIMPIPIAVEGFQPVVINQSISKQDEHIYVNLYDEINDSLKNNNCDRFNCMYYLHRQVSLPPWVGVCLQNKYFCFQDDNVRNDGSKRLVNFAEIIKPDKAKGCLRKCDIIFAKPVVKECSLLSDVAKNREEYRPVFLLYQAICQVVPSYEEAFIEFMSNNSYYKNDMFVTSRELFAEYVNVTALVLNWMNKEKYSLQTNFFYERVAEMLLNIIVINKKCEIATCPVINFRFDELNFS